MSDSLGVAERIYEYIRRAHGSLRLVGRPGLVKVSSRRLARRFSVNGRSISRAISLLESMGALRIIEKRRMSNGTIYILEVDPDRRLRDLVELRRARIEEVVRGATG